MTPHRLLEWSERWFRLLTRLYPPDFRDALGQSVVETYMDRARHAVHHGGALRLSALWCRALVDSGVNAVAERVRPAVAWRRAGNWGRDIESATRRLVRSPAFAATTIGTLAIGLGMFAVVYTAVQRVLIDPMPYKNAGDLYYVWRAYGGTVDIRRGSLAGTDVAELQKSTAVIEDAAALMPYLGGVLSRRDGSEPMEVAATWTSPNVFQLLGVSPVLGRGFAPGEMGPSLKGGEIGPGPGQVMVVSHQLWQRLGSDAGIVGTDLRFQGRPFTVIGVLPEDFRFVRNHESAPPQRVDAYIPFGSNLAVTDPSTNGYAGLVRARQGASPAAVAEAVDAVGRAIDARDFNNSGLRLYAVALKADVISRIRPALVVLGASALVLLFMLMANLASVLLARAAEREHEVAVSRALGASTGAIARSTLLEGGLLGLAGGGLGVLAATWGTSALVALAPLDLPRRESIAVDWRIVMTVIAIGGVLGTLAAAWPAVWAARTSLQQLLAASAVRGGGGQRRWRRGLIATQVALSLILLSSGAVVARSFERLLRADPGFQPEGVFTVRLRTPPEFFPRMEDAIAFQDRVTHTLSGLPGVSGASAASALPLTATAFQTMVTAPAASGNTGDVERDRILTDLIGVRANYVEVMGMRLLAGRPFTEPRPAGVAEVMIDEAIVRQLFPDGKAIGATIRVGERPLTVVGVVQQARLYDIHTDGRPQVLVRSEDFGMRPLFYVMRTARDPHALAPEVRAAIRRLEPRIPVGDPRAMDDIVDLSLSPQSVGAALVGALAVGGLLLAAMGLFGVVSAAVTRRRHELAVRLALGAEQGDALRLVLKEGALLVAIGLVIGAPGIFIANRLVERLVVGVSPFDPLTLMAAAGGLLLVTLTACYVPARRALRIEPARLLRQG